MYQVIMNILGITASQQGLNSNAIYIAGALILVIFAICIDNIWAIFRVAIPRMRNK